MENCYQGITVPTPIVPPCGGEYISTECVATPAPIVVLDIPAGDTQAHINTAIANALQNKDNQITDINNIIEPYRERRIYRGTFLGSILSTPVESTINDLAIVNSSTGIYTLTSSAFTLATNILITPNSATDDVVITYNYVNALTGVITFRVKNITGVLVNLLESPIKIEG